jgi:hypothetical protein
MGNEVEPMVLYEGKRLPSPISDALIGTGTSGMINLPQQLFITALADFRTSDAEVFRGPARFRVGLGQTFMLISLSFRTLNFDVIWSPHIAATTGEPDMEKPDDGAHLLFNFVLADGIQIARSIRTATISPQCATAIWRAQQELNDRKSTPEDLEKEMIDLFNRYPTEIPDMFFHETCSLGD